MMKKKEKELRGRFSKIMFLCPETQKALALEIGIHRITLSEFLCGMRTSQLKSLCKIERYIISKEEELESMEPDFMEG
jgi:hypothetical protein